ncbi:hypothetical protein EVAR_102209_1 [Eumeta japonica]|uniref:Uncharacterized protein n=1 Tax=Eumeta variegata TaxID=151549 RepID=A0A4C1WCZ6_EUMVA|nr:hypothetical protein EVAR_102209_1 [Eumeta japonica]
MTYYVIYGAEHRGYVKTRRHSAPPARPPAGAPPKSLITSRNNALNAERHQIAIRGGPARAGAPLGPPLMSDLRELECAMSHLTAPAMCLRARAAERRRRAALTLMALIILYCQQFAASSD